MKYDIRNLIDSYIKIAGELSHNLQLKYNVCDLLKARREGKLPKSGKLDSGWNYEFHGVGCRFDKSGIAVDIDFGYNGRCDGFDAWRLLEFANSNPDIILKLDELENALAGLEASGIIYRPSLNPSPHLYYMVDSQGSQA